MSRNSLLNKIETPYNSGGVLDEDVERTRKVKKKCIASTVKTTVEH